jgi:hypothetical protein
LHLSVLPKRQYIKASTHINTRDTEDVFGLLDSLYHLVETRKQSTLDKVEVPEEKTMRVSKFAEGYEHVEGGIRVLEDADWNEQQQDKE